MISYSYVRQTRQTKFASYLVNFYVHGRIVIHWLTYWKNHEI